MLGLLLGVALVFLLRGEQGPLPWVARIAAYFYAAFYTGLDTRWRASARGSPWLPSLQAARWRST